MKLNDLSGFWFETGSVAILSLPFISYAVEPDFLNTYIPEEKHTFTISYKGNFPYPIETQYKFHGKEAAKRACEAHLEKLVNFLFGKLEGVIDFGELVTH